MREKKEISALGEDGQKILTRSGGKAKNDYTEYSSQALASSLFAPRPH